MKKVSVAKWAQTRDISIEEINNCLEELGYQVQATGKGRTKWKLTEKGQRYARFSVNPLSRQILWDIDAFFDVLKLQGKKTREYFYCDECNAYLGYQYGFEPNMNKWVCKKCGCVNKLYYDPDDFGWIGG